MKSKRFTALLLIVAMVLGFTTIPASAAWSNGPKVSLSAGELNGDKLAVTISVSATAEGDPVKGYTLGVVYDPELVEPDSSAGTYKNDDEETVGISFESPDTKFDNRNQNVLITPAGKDDDGNTFFQVVAANGSKNGITYQGFSITYHFLLTDKALKNGGLIKFSISNGVSGGDTPAFGVSGPDGKNADYPQNLEDNTDTVAIPASSVEVTGTIDAQLKGNTAPTVDLAVTDGFKVEPTWSPALKDGKFEAGKTYTLNVKVSEDGGKFADDAAVTADESLQLSSFTKSGSAFTATRTFVIPTAALTAIEVTTQPTKTSYVDGDKFDPAGMVVKATYDDGSTDDNFTDYTTAPETLTKGDDTVTLIATADNKITTTVTITVEGKKDGLAAEFTPDKVTAPYSGEDLTETLTKDIKHDGIDGKVTYTFQQDSKEVVPINVGEYDVYAAVTGDAHYADGKEKVATATVTAKEVSPKIDTIDDQDYTGEQITPTITVTCGSGTLVEGTDYTIEYGENKNVSDGGTVTIKPVEGSNYTFAEVTQKFNIKPIVAQIKWTEETKLTYTGKEQSVTAEITNLVNDDKAELTYEANSATDVGEYTAKITSLDNENYTLEGVKNLEQAWSIAKADYKDNALTGKTTVPTKGATDKTYALSQLNLPKEFVDTSVTDVKYDGIVTAAKADGDSIVFSTKEAQDGDTGTITLTIASKNYNDVTATVTVTAKDVVVPDNFWADNVETTDIEYGQTVGDAVTIKNATPSIKDGNGNDLAGELKVDSAEVVPNAGEAKATVTFTVTADGDYKDTPITQEVTFTVKQKEVKVNWADTELTYNGEAQKPTATAEGVNNEKLTLTVSGEQTDAGEYKATVELTEVIDGNAKVENYKLTETETDFTIKSAEISGVVKIEPAENVTKGTELKANVDEVTGDELTYQWNKDGKAIEGATGETYTTTIDDVNSKITVTVTSTGNYEGSLDSAAVTVKKSELTGEITITGEDELTATVTTDDPDAADYYDVVWMCEGKQVGTGETFTVTSAVRGKTVTAKAVAKDKFTGELVSDELEIPATAPSFDSTPKVTAGNGTLTVTLDAEPNGAEITEYTITVTDPDGKETVIKVPGTESSYTIKDLKNGTTYTVIVTATNEKGSTPSDPVTGTPKQNNPPVLPPDVTPGTNPNPNPNPNPEQNPDTFADVEKGSFYEDAVKWALENGITTGKTDQFFAPYAVCTRAETVTFLWRAAGKPTPASTVNPFIDVAPDAFYYTAVLWAAEQGITTGTSADTFSPNEIVSRGQMVTFLWRAAGKPAANAVNPFADVAADAYYTDAVLWAVGRGITNGTSATTFSPDAGCTRAQIVTFLYRFYA